MTYHFINLTNGIEAIKEYNLVDYRFIRIQSTACEQKRFENVLMEISDDFLMLVALGHTCIVYDYSNKREVPRAIWQGLEWIKFVLMKIWFDITYVPEGRGNNCSNYFEDIYDRLGDRAKKRIRYFKKFTGINKRNRLINIVVKTSKTVRDGDSLYYINEIVESERLKCQVVLKGHDDYGNVKLLPNS